EAVALALDDAGLQKSDVDGLLINGNGNEHMTPYLQMALGFQDLSMLNVMSAAGSTVGAMVQYAALALEAGVVSNVVLLYADAPLQQNIGAAEAYAKRGQWHGMNGLRAAYGEFGGNPPFALAGITRDDVDVLELYDCYTYTVLVTLEDYGYCGKGEGGSFVADGKLGPGGSLPTNTGGGQLSSYYMWGFTPLSEAVIQARG